jgi:hypothetical protein
MELIEEFKDSAILTALDFHYRTLPGVFSEELLVSLLVDAR